MSERGARDAATQNNATAEPTGETRETDETGALDASREPPETQLRRGQNMSYWARRMRKYAKPPEPTTSERADDADHS